MNADADGSSSAVQCCIVGGGPAGMMLGTLLARAGVRTLVLEKHADFLRDFRGDTVHPSTLRIMDELGLLERFLERPHQKLEVIGGWFGKEHVQLGDFRGLPVRYAFIAMMPQWEFLDFLADHAAAVFDQAGRFAAHPQLERRQRSRVVGDEVEELPLRHHRDEAAPRAQPRKVGDHRLRAADHRADVEGLVMRAFQECVEETKFVHHLECRRMHRVAAKVAQEIVVLLKHDDLDAGSREQERQHHAGGSATGDAASGRVSVLSHKYLCSRCPASGRRQGAGAGQYLTY